jgi:chromosome segregation protein
MLKAIELTGFKSFADKTRFEFREGVTVVVGPNGSGKSNVVDAIKWVLGSQSAKSLRGKEMADVIFNGSSSRGQLHAAEVTLTVDNSNNFLELDFPEVHITRRVYRSGEGEYLVNRQPCRLRDIRDLLAGTGIATEAYSIIEQGKVDVLLQASPRERRAIFEEAAGVSRFKSKRAEAIRRLERAEQNLLRLSDLVDEVESRLRSLRVQAGKARRYRDCAGRLEELRTSVGLADWGALNKHIDQLDAKFAKANQNLENQLAVVTQREEKLNRLEKTFELNNDALREIQAESLAIREQISSQRGTAENGGARCFDLENQIGHLRQQRAAMSLRASDAFDHAQKIESQFQAAHQELEFVNAEWNSAQAELQMTLAKATELKAEIDRLRTKHDQEVLSKNALASQLQVLNAEQRTTEMTRSSYGQQFRELGKQRSSLEDELTNCEQLQGQRAHSLEKAQDELTESELTLADQRHHLTRTRKKISQLERERARVGERVAVLEELELRREGYSAGVKEVLEKAQQEPEGPFGDTCGVVANLLHVDVDTAPLVEVAVGDKAQHILIRSGDRLLEHLQHNPGAVVGRVALLRLDTPPAASAIDRIDLSTEPGVLGRADTFVETDPSYALLAARLLGRTWFVESLATAIRLTTTLGRGLSFVTSDGELLAADGTLVIGQRQATTGLLTRVSELRAGRDQTEELQRQILSQKKMLAHLEEELSNQEVHVSTSRQTHTQLAKELTVLQTKIANLQSTIANLQKQQDPLATELISLSDRLETSTRKKSNLTQEHAAAETDVAQLAQEFEREKHLLPTIEDRQRHWESKTADARVEAATCKQRAEILQAQVAQIHRDQEEREQALADVHERLAEFQQQVGQVELQILQANQEIASLALRRQTLNLEVRRREITHQAIRQQRSTEGHDLKEERQHVNELQNKVGRIEVAANKVRHERETLWERLRDDYGIDLKTIATQDNDAMVIANRREVEQEIAELRAKLNSIGAVNLDALDELDVLEERFTRLSAQYQDLVDSKTALERIISRINIDSRQLFTETLNTVRSHFQELFRRLFGGGQADIIIEEGDQDILESGVEIVACPPGKDMRTISLLSGGEKTLTCVALLLAVFRSKPSPFCVLDEVDAALDEANIGRFTNVLGEFLSSTQFIVITHSKKTMSGANALYGVTMQESGISKLVSVRFEDVTEDGHILPTAGRLADPNQDASTDRHAA